MTNTKTNGIETGCYIDGRHGIYSIELLYDLVLDLVDHETLPDDIDDMGVVIRHSLYGDMGARVSAFGRNEYDDDGTRTGNGLGWVDANEYAMELYDELTELLPADDDRVWMWSDGDLFYASIDDAREWSE